jgi:HlyD family secretion protein
MKLNPWGFLLLAAGALILLALWWSKPKVVESVAVLKDRITQSIVATGRVAPAARVDIGSLVNANIKQIHAFEGEKVTTGQPLITLTDSAIEAALAQAKASLVEAQQRSNELTALTRPLAQSALEQAQANLTLAKADYQRNLELSQKNMLAKTTLDQAKRNLDINQSALESSKLQIEATQERGSSSRVIQARLEQAQSALALAQAKIDQLSIIAPIDGIILTRNAEVGSTAQLGKPLFTLASTSETRIELPIDEKSIRHLKPNQTATVIADAYPKHPFPAKLTLIYPSVDATRATVNVRLLVENPPDFLKPDMTVSVEMRTDYAENALILPTDAIHNADTEQPWVQVIRNGKVEQQNIQTGIRGIGNTQVLSGLAEGDWVITQAGVKMDLRVTPKAREAQIVRGFDLPNGFK